MCWLLFRKRRFVTMLMMQLIYKLLAIKKLTFSKFKLNPMENRFFEIILYSLLSLNFVIYTKVAFRILQKMLSFFSHFGDIFQRRINLMLYLFLFPFIN